MKILITGVSGTGKSTICKNLINLGYEASDIENIKGMFEMYHKDTKAVFEEFDNSIPHHIKSAEWICDIGKLKKLVESKKSGIAFYCGVASNMDDLIPLFDKVIVLQPDPDVLNVRLKNREGTDDIGNNQNGRDVILGWKDWWEKEMHKKGGILVNANASSQKTTEKILDILNLPHKALK